MKKKLFIYGAGGHGKVIADILREAGYSIAGFLDDNKNKKGIRILNYEVLGDWSYISDPHICSIVPAVGDNRKRKRLYLKAQVLGIDVINAIHPRACLAKNVKIGNGIVIMANAVINTDTIIDNGSIVNTSSSIDHDCHIGEFVHICPGVHIAGSVKINSFSFIGIGSSIIQNIRIGKNVIIGAGSVVISNIPNDVKAIGIPARILKI